MSSSNTTIQGNWIGTNAAGTAAAGNGNGIQLINANNDLIGTDGDGVNDAAERNVISGNTVDGILIFQSNSNTVAGNYIGTNAAGTAAVGNGNFGVEVSEGGSTSNNNIIGTNGSNDAFNADEKNIISANAGGGVSSDGANTVVAGNWIGLDVNGAALGNGGSGINMTGPNSRIGTNADGIADTAERNVIDPNNTWGIYAIGSGDVVAGNYVGTDPTGTTAFSSSGRAVEIGSNVTVGGTAAAARNVISGSTVGIYLNGVANSTIVGNYIGTDAAGTSALPNVDGVHLVNSASGNTIGGAAAGAANVISGNTNFGVVDAGAGTVNTVLDNLIGVTADQSASLANTLGSISIPSGGVVLAGGTLNGSVNDSGTLDLDGNNVSIVGGADRLGRVTNSATGVAATLTINGTGTFSGSIADGGAATTALAIAGGTETLTGANTYSGATTISAGTLKVGNGGATGSLGSGAIVDNATLFYDLSSSINVANAISGSGTLNLTSTGGSISQSVAITVPTVATSAKTGITLTGAGNTISTFSATNSTSGAISLTNTITTIITGATAAGSGAINLTATGPSSDILINGNVTTTGQVNITSAGSVSESPTSAGSSLAALASFNGSGNGDDPNSDLIEDSNGNFFGTTVDGGPFNDGTIFEVTAGTHASPRSPHSPAAAMGSPRTSDWCWTVKETSSAPRSMAAAPGSGLCSSCPVAAARSRRSPRSTERTGRTRRPGLSSIAVATSSVPPTTAAPSAMAPCSRSSPAATPSQPWPRSTAPTETSPTGA